MALLIRAWRHAVQIRITGLAAEMTFFALLSLWPMLAALGASLGFLERFLGGQQIAAIETTVVNAMRAVFSPDAVNTVIGPMVQGLLEEERAGFAIGGFVVALWLGSRVFRAALRALDDAYRVERRRGSAALWAMAFLYSIAALVTATTVLSLVVVGPFLGGGQQVAAWLGLGDLFEILWNIGRWPVVGLVVMVFLSLLYYWGPNIRNSWRWSLPGAAVAVVGILVLAGGFQFFLQTFGPDAPTFGTEDEAVLLGAQIVGAVLVALVWIWLSSILVLAGGVLNAELRAKNPPAVRRRLERDRERKHTGSDRELHPVAGDPDRTVEGR